MRHLVGEQAVERPSMRSGGSHYEQRALLLWPGLSRRDLRSAAGNPERITSLVSRRTGESPSIVFGMLTGVSVEVL